MFSAVTSAFIIEVNSQLQPDSGDETAALLRVLIYEINNTAFGDNIPTLPQWTGPPPTMVNVQAILFASLSISLISAFLAMLGKQWLNRYSSTDMRGSAVERSRNRQRKLDGIVTWYFNHVMESLPMMLQAALLLLGCALSRYLWDISTTVASVVVAITSFGMLFFLFIIFAGAVSESCPYQTPGSLTLRHLGPKVWSIIRSAPSLVVLVRSTFTSAIRNALKRSSVVAIVAENAKENHPWWSIRKIIPSFGVLVLKVPLGFAVDIYHLLRAAIRELFALPFGAYHLVRRTFSRLYNVFSTLKQKLGRQEIPSDFRCISWTLQTSLDKPVHLTALTRLEMITELAGLDPTLAMGCFNVFVGCVRFSGNKLVVIQGLEQLAAVSAGCLFRAYHHLRVADPTSSVLTDLRRRYDKVFPFETDFRGLPFYHTIMKIHDWAGKRWNPHNLQWDDYRPSCQEHVTFATHMAEIAQLEHQQTQREKVPGWILHFALHSLSFDPPPPASVVADCLSIVAIDLDCGGPYFATSDERCA